MIKCSIKKESGGRFLLCLLMAILFTMAFLANTTLGAKDPAYPIKPITLIVPWAPGSAVDLVPRIMAPYLSKKLGVPVNIINKPGGSGIVGTLEAVTASPDGHIILSDCPGSSSIHIAWVKDLPYKVEERSFLARAVVFPTVIVVRANSPWKTLQDLEQEIRKDPANFRWGGVGTTQSDFGMYLLKSGLVSKGVDLSKTKTVSFQSGAPAMVALAGGNIDIYCGTFSLVQSYVSAGKARIIAVASTERTKIFPGVPTAAEQGFPSVNTDFWVGYSGPKGLPKNITQTWMDHVKEVVSDPNILPELEKLGGTPGFLGIDEFRKFVMDEAREIKAVSEK